MSGNRKLTDAGYKDLPTEIKLHIFSFFNNAELFHVSHLSRESYILAQKNARTLWENKLKKDFHTDLPANGIEPWLFYKILTKEKSNFISYIKENSITQFLYEPEKDEIQLDQIAMKICEEMNQLCKSLPIDRFEKILDLILQKVMDSTNIVNKLFQMDVIEDPFLLFLKGSENEEIITRFSAIAAYINPRDYPDCLSEEEEIVLNAADEKTKNAIKNVLIIYRLLEKNIPINMVCTLCRCDAPNLLSIFLDKLTEEEQQFLLPHLMLEAVGHAKLNTVKILIDKKANVNSVVRSMSKDDSLLIWHTPLSMAILSFNRLDIKLCEDIIKLLINEGADINRVFCCKRGQDERRISSLKEFADCLLMQIDSDETINEENKIAIRSSLITLSEPPGESYKLCK